MSRKDCRPFLLPSRKSSLLKEKKDFPGRSGTGLDKVEKNKVSETNETNRL